MCIFIYIYILHVQSTDDQSTGTRKWAWDAQICVKPPETIGDHPLADTFFAFRMEVITKLQGPPTLAMSISSSK